MADDLGVVYTDRKLQMLENKLEKIYSQAEKDIAEKIDKFFEKAAAKEKVLLQKVSNEEMTQEEFDHWKQGKIFIGQNWAAQQQNIAHVLSNANTIATNVINGERTSVFAFNGNYTAYEIEHGFGVNFGFDLYSEQSVERLLQGKPSILPKQKLNVEKDEKWNMHNIRAQITQGIIQGESIPKIAQRLSEVVPDRNKKQMVLHARTAMTAAQNAGRMERFEEAESLGIKFKKVWLATLDDRTRDTHADLDGQAVNPDEPFKIDGYEIDYPGDPHAAPEMVYNCRCTMTTELDDYPSSFSRRETSTGKVIEDMSYREWDQWKQKDAEPEAQHTIVQGKDISETWERRADKFDFEIDDVINAQGFDGLPRVVSAEEFDDAVKESNFIAQRVYSAPDQETLDAYRDQLYNGDWYVDCSTGGAHYGCGMYGTANNGTSITPEIKDSMEFYTDRSQYEFVKYRKETEEEIISRNRDFILRNYPNVSDDIETVEKIVYGRLNGNLSDSDFFQLYKSLPSDEKKDVNSMLRSLKGRISPEVIEVNNSVSYIETFTIDKSANTIKFSEISEMKRHALMNAADYSEAEKINDMDYGSFAALRGYDAITNIPNTIAGNPEVDVIILNRTKVVFKGD